jgi:hypothetical protein
MFVTFVKIQRREWDSNPLKNSFNNIENTVASVKQWKAVASSANGSRLTGHSKSADEGGRNIGTFTFTVSPRSRQRQWYERIPSQSPNFRVADDSGIIGALPMRFDPMGSAATGLLASVICC